MTHLGEDDSRRSALNSATDVVEKAKATARDVQAAAKDLAQSSQEAVKAHDSNALDAAKDLAASTQERMQDKLAEQKGVGADYAEGFARSMCQAAGQFDTQAPLAATYIRKAAGQIEGAADALRDGNLNDLIQGVQKFARSQPTGFGAVRFLKSETAEGTEDRGGSGDPWANPEMSSPTYTDRRDM